MDGDGKIGNHPTRSTSAMAPEQQPAQPVLSAGILSGLLQNPALQNVVKSGFGSFISGNKVKPAPGSGGFAALSGMFNNMSPDIKTRAEAESAKLDDGSNMQLSQCNGKKKSLLIGCNYVGTPSPLKGCINDVKAVRTFIVDKMHFPTDSSSMRILTDDGEGYATPTRAEILNGMKWLIAGAQNGDSLFIHYSGHGSTSKVVDTDEADGQEETLVPLDFQTAGIIIDDEIFEILVQPLPRGVRLTAIMDCCHSGSVFDLPYSYVLEAGRDLPTEIDNRKVAIAAALAAGKALVAGDGAGVMKNILEAAKAGALFYASTQQSTPGSSVENPTQQLAVTSSAPLSAFVSAGKTICPSYVY